MIGGQKIPDTLEGLHNSLLDESFTFTHLKSSRDVWRDIQILHCEKLYLNGGRKCNKYQKIIFKILFTSKKLFLFQPKILISKDAIIKKINELSRKYNKITKTDVITQKLYRIICT